MAFENMNGMVQSTLYRFSLRNKFKLKHFVCNKKNLILFIEVYFSLFFYNFPFQIHIKCLVQQAVG